MAMAVAAVPASDTPRATSCSGGLNDFTLFMVMLFDPARSAVPVHNSGITSAKAHTTSPDAA
jgi:hypothetical protein